MKISEAYYCTCSDNQLRRSVLRQKLTQFSFSTTRWAHTLLKFCKNVIEEYENISLRLFISYLNIDKDGIHFQQINMFANQLLLTFDSYHIEGENKLHHQDIDCMYCMKKKIRQIFMSKITFN